MEAESSGYFNIEYRLENPGDGVSDTWEQAIALAVPEEDVNEVIATLQRWFGPDYEFRRTAA